MLHNLFIVNKESGIPIGTIKLSEKGIDKEEADLISSSIKAIQDFFKNLKFGELETFQFLKRQIIIHKKSNVLLILVCEKETDLDRLHPKLELIAMMFDKTIDWFEWDGVISKYDDLVKSTKNILLET
mgnify:CR=1 FL=1